MGAIVVPNTFVAHTVVYASEVNANFTALTTKALNKEGDTMTGVLVVPLGAVGGPAVAATGGTTTGLYFPSASTVALSLAGTQRLLLDTNGLTIYGVNIVNSSGKIPALSSTYFASLSGADLTGLSATQLTSGTVDVARLANITNSQLSASAAIVDTKLATISTAGKVSNSATTATALNTVSTIVARDGSGNFAAGTITATFTGNLTGNVTGNVTGNATGNAGTVTNGVYTNGSYADPTWLTSLAKSKVGLGSVENTALSTWAGSANIITVGTIGTGTWQGNIIGPTYLGTGTSITTKYLRGDGTWQTLGGGTGTVTSVAMTVPAQFTVSGSPITTSGTLAVAWGSQAGNMALASPNGTSGTPGFRALVAADIPTLSGSKISGGTAAVDISGTAAVASAAPWSGLTGDAPGVSTFDNDSGYLVGSAGYTGTIYAWSNAEHTNEMAFTVVNGQITAGA